MNSTVDDGDPEDRDRPILAWEDLAESLWLAAVVLAPGGARVEDAPDLHRDDRPAALPEAAPPPPPPRTDPGPPTGGSSRLVDTPEWSRGGLSADLTAGPVHPVLAGTRALARALRPLQRRVASKVETEPDEEATAERAADDGLWLPLSRPAQARWLSVVLIVDAAPSMAVWRPTVTALRMLLEQHGAFRTVREYLLCPGADSSDGRFVGPHIRAPGAGPRNPAELLDPSGRQIFLIFSDGLGPHWRDGRTGRLLRQWGRSGPLAIVNPYPQDHWLRSNLVIRRHQVRAPRPLTPNDRLLIRRPARLRNPFEEPVPPASMAVPVLELSSRWIGWWARLLADPHGWVDAAVHWVDPGVTVPPGPADEPMDQASAEELVLRFRSGASRQAYQLAALFAAAPLDLPVLRQVQRTMLPESAPFHLAEVITSDLVRHHRGRQPPLDFVDGARGALLASARRDDSARVVRVVAAHYQLRGLAEPSLTRVIEAPEHAPDPVITAETLVSARIELAVLTALSGPYARRAQRLRESIAAVEHALANPGPADPMRQPGGAAEPAGGSGVQEVGDPMSVHPDETGAPMPDDPVGRPPFDDDAAGRDESPIVWGNVPPRNPVFIGRDELLVQLERRIATDSVAAVLPQALHGMGGVGKSQIAIEYVYRHRDEFEVIWWVPSEQPAQILASLIELGKALGLDVGAEANTAVPRVRAALRAGTPYANWLLVFDNAETLDTVRDYLPESGSGKVLVTSRNPQWSSIAETLEVDVFTRAESIALLQRRSPDLSDADADRLAEAIGDLPLAVEHASAWQAATGMPVDEYLGLLNEKRLELEALVPTPGYELSVAAAANVALDRLAVENPAALQLIQVCSFLAPEPISRDLFSGPRFTPIAPELDTTLQNPGLLSRAIRDIQRYVLARVDHRTNTIQLHRLVQAVVQSRIPEDQRSRVEHGAHVLLAGVSPGSPTDQTQWTRYQTLASHLATSHAIGCQDDWARELVINVIRFYYYWGDYRRCRDLAEESVDAWQVNPGRDHDQTLRAAKWLGFVSRALGDFARAAEINNDCLARYLGTVGPDDDGTIDAMSLVASDHRVAGRFTDARDLDLDAFQRARRLYGEDEPETLSAAHSLGVSLRLTGDFRAARQVDSDTYERRVAILRAEHPNTLLTLNGLTLDERECGEYVTAHRRVERLYQRHIELFGPQHPLSMAVARNLAVARRRAGDHEGARKLSEETTHRLYEHYAAAHHEAIAATLNFAVDVRESDDLLRAHSLAAQAAQQYETTLGADHPYTHYAQTNLAIVLRLLGQPEEAHRYNNEAWTALKRLLGPSHVITLTCAINLASDQAGIGDVEGARRLGSDTVSLCRQLLGPEHPTTLAGALNLAFDMSALGETEAAEALYLSTMDLYTSTLGADHPAIRAATVRVRANCDVDPMPF
jgi:tetratricopeptide (TPR) repeat protein